MADKENNKPKLSPAKTASRSGTTRPGSTKPRAGKYVDEYASSPLSVGNIRSGVLHSVGVKIVLGLLIVIFAIGFAFSGFGGGGNAGNNPVGGGGSGPDPIARVGSQTVGRGEFQRAATQQLEFSKQFGQKTGVTDLLNVWQRSLQSVMDQAAIVETARLQGITVSNDEIDAKIKSLIEEPLKAKGSEGVNARRQIEAQFGSMEEYEAEKRKEIDRELVERLLLTEKLEKKVKDDNKVTEADYKKSVTKLKLRQLTIRPGFPSPNEKDIKAAQEKNQNAAHEQAAKIAAQLKAKPTLQNFLTIARQEMAKTKPAPPPFADLRAAAKGKGAVPTPQPMPLTQVTSNDLGWKMPVELPLSQAMKDAVMAANGNLVGPVEDETTHESNFFWIEGRKLELPKDYAKTKAKKLEDYETERDNQAWTDFQEKSKKKIETQITDPLLEAYKIQNEQLITASGAEADKLRQTALDKYEEALAYAAPMEAAAIHYQRAQLYRYLNKNDKVIEELQASLKSADKDTTVQVELAQMLRVLEKKKEAMLQLTALSKQLDDAPSAPPAFGGPNPDDQVRMQIASEYEQMGRKDLADKERKKIKPPAPGGMGGMGGFNLGGAGGGNIQIPPR